MAKIQLNGDGYEINNGSNLSELLIKLKIEKSKVAIEVNGEIVERKKPLKNIIVVCFCFVRKYVTYMK